MLERLLLSLAIVGVGWAMIAIFHRLRLARRIREGLMLDAYRLGRPALLYFSSEDCAPCRAVQRPELDRLLRAYGERLQVIEIDALRNPRLADSWGVLSLPTTFLIDAEGRPRGVNHGAVRALRLTLQLENMGAAAANPGLISEPASAE